ncbi:MAG TPA: hypothetical protein VEL31_26065 [Ktedonobacteraceae bacterium]|nr:hypothetical protein [Ktedonobacteraceae bacterium]
MTTSTTNRFLPRAEEYRLFTLIWKNLPGAQEARETLIQDNLAAVRNYILRYPPTRWFEFNDACHEAYAALAESLDKIPATIRNPGVYLYRMACHTVQWTYHSLADCESLDAALPGTETFTHYDVLTAPTTMPVDPRRPTLYSALRRLPLHYQRALHQRFHLPAFCPHANSRKPSPACSQSRYAMKHLRARAYAELRRDPKLIAALGEKGVQA